MNLKVKISYKSTIMTTPFNNYTPITLLNTDLTWGNNKASRHDHLHV